MSNKESEIKKFIGQLINGQLREVVGEDKFPDFQDFLESRAYPVKGFVLDFRLEEGGLTWVFYRLKERNLVSRIRRITEVILPPEFNLPGDKGALNTDKPEEWQEYPVWHLY